MASPRIENPAARDAHNAAMAASGENPDQYGGNEYQTRSFVPSGFAPGGHRKAPLTLQEQREVIARGESVLYNGEIVSHQSRLPTEAQLAIGDPEKEAIAANHMQEQIRKLQADLEALKTGTLATAPSAPGVGPGVLPPQTASAVNQPASEAQGGPAMTEAQRKALQEAQRKALLQRQQTEQAT